MGSKKEKGRRRQRKKPIEAAPAEDDGKSNGIHHGDIAAKRHKLASETYATELARLQVELIKHACRSG